MYFLRKKIQKKYSTTSHFTVFETIQMGAWVHFDFQSYIQWLQDKACASEKLESSPTAHSDVPGQTAPLNPSDTSITSLSQMPWISSVINELLVIRPRSSRPVLYISFVRNVKYDKHIKLVIQLFLSFCQPRRLIVMIDKLRFHFL